MDGWSLRAAGRRGSPGWRYETSTQDYGQLVSVIDRIRGELDVSVRYTARLASVRRHDQGAQLAPLHARLGRSPGMVMATEGGVFELVERVEQVPLTTPVYDLDVARTHNFVANGLVTHNSIYAFRAPTSATSSSSSVISPARERSRSSRTIARPTRS